MPPHVLNLVTLLAVEVYNFFSILVIATESSSTDSSLREVALTVKVFCLSTASIFPSKIAGETWSDKILHGEDTNWHSHTGSEDKPSEQ